MRGKTNIRVRYEETDQMGMAYHGNYLAWMEVGRTEFFRDLGMPYKSFEEQGVFLPVIEVGCKYKRPVRYDDFVSIETEVTQLTPVKISFNYVFTLEDEIMAQGFTTHAFVNSDGRPINTAKKASALYAWLEEHFVSAKD